MANCYSLETPVHVNDYWRFRYNKWEHVCEHYRRSPKNNLYYKIKD